MVNPRNKKNLHQSMIRKILHIEENMCKARRWQKSLIFPKYSWVSGGVATIRKFSNFPLSWKEYLQHLNWRKTVVQIKAFLFLKNWQFNHKLGPPLSSTNTPCLKGYSRNLIKYEINGTSKIPVSQLFSELGKTWKCNIGLNPKNPIIHLFQRLGKIEKSS